MKATELRVGNKVFHQNKVKKVEAIIATGEDGPNLALGYKTMFEYVFITSSDLVPIPLTEEWLLKFGFECKDTNFDGGHHYWALSKKEVLFSTPFEDATEVYIDGIDPTVKYVHQLQNLYFALTGEELPYDPHDK